MKNKLIVFIGESGSGKTTLIANLTEKYPEQFKKIVTCTSRPKRISEIDGVDYHFLPAGYFINNPSLVLVKKTYEGFYYATKSLDLLSSTHHLLLTLRIAGAKKLIGLGLKNIIIAHISISDELKTKRMRQRGDTEEMILSRLQSDVENRVEIDLGEVPIVNLDATQTIHNQINLIVGLS